MTSNQTYGLGVYCSTYHRGASSLTLHFDFHSRSPQASNGFCRSLPFQTSFCIGQSPTTFIAEQRSTSNHTSTTDAPIFTRPRQPHSKPPSKRCNNSPLITGLLRRIASSIG